MGGGRPLSLCKRLRRNGEASSPLPTRGWKRVGRKSDVEPGQLPARRVAHVHAHTRVLHDMCYRRSGKRRKGLTRRTTAFPSFVLDRSASRRVRRLRPKTRLAGAGEALSYPPGAPHPHTAPAQPNYWDLSDGQALQLSRRTMNGKLQIAGSLREDGANLIRRCLDPCPSPSRLPRRRRHGTPA